MSFTRRRTLFTNGTIWRGPDRPDATELLVEGSTISAIGAQPGGIEVDHVADRVVDLRGGFLMPSFGEGHAHPIFGGLEDVGPAIRQCGSVAEIVDSVRAYAQQHPEQEWILGASYDGSLVAGGLFRAAWLDAAVPDRPVVLRAWDYHTVWCNSKALELAGIDANTPEPELGQIPRDEEGKPLGILREWGAIDLLGRVNPGYGFEDRVQALGRAGEKFAKLGVTWVQDAWVEPGDVAVYLEAARRGLLKTRMNLALLADPRSFPATLPGMLDARAAVQALENPLLSAQSVKFFVDGVVENETGGLLEPYCTGLHEHGMLLWEAGQLARAVAAVDAAGFQPHLHAIGDAAVRMALDAIEYASGVNGPSKNRPAIAHVQLAQDTDLARFAELGVIAVMQPLWAQLDPLMTVLTVPRLGAERAARQYKMRTLENHGAVLAFGSDWPCSSAAPFDGIAIAVSRSTEEDQPAGGWVPQERLGIEAALNAYTRGVAHQAKADCTAAGWGTVEPGASADLVWLDADPRLVSAKELPRILVNATYLAGQATYLRGTADAIANTVANSATTDH